MRLGKRLVDAFLCCASTEIPIFRPAGFRQGIG